MRVMLFDFIYVGRGSTENSNYSYHNGFFYNKNRGKYFKYSVVGKNFVVESWIFAGINLMRTNIGALCVVAEITVKAHRNDLWTMSYLGDGRSLGLTSHIPFESRCLHAPFDISAVFECSFSRENWFQRIATFSLRSPWMTPFRRQDVKKDIIVRMKIEILAGQKRRESLPAYRALNLL